MAPAALCQPWPSSISGWKDKPGLHIIPLSPWNCPGPGAPAALTRKISGSPETGGMCQITTTPFPHQPVTLVPPSQQALPIDNGLVPPWDYAQGQSVSFPHKDPQQGGEGITVGAQYTGTQSPPSPSFFPTLASLASRGRPGPSLRVPGVLWDRFPGEASGKKKKKKKNPPGNAGDSREVDSIPRWGRPPGGRNGNPLQNSWTEEPGELQSVGSQRIGLSTRRHTHKHNWTHTHTSD